MQKENNSMIKLVYSWETWREILKVVWKWVRRKNIETSRTCECTQKGKIHKEKVEGNDQKRL